VTAGRPGNRRPHSLAEMAGGGDRLVMGTLHLLLLLTAALSPAAGSVSRGASAWTEDKVRGCLCVSYPVRGPRTPPAPPRQAGAGQGCVPCPGIRVPTQRPGDSALNVLAWVLRPPPGFAADARGLGDVTGLPSAVLGWGC
jgi:hypothetical protein